MTQLEQARKGIITPQMQEVAQDENRNPEFIREGVARGTIVIPANTQRKAKAVGYGAGLRTKVSASIGLMPEFLDVNEEIEKLNIAVAAGTNAIMDLSTAGDIDGMRGRVLRETILPVGTLPIYQAATEAIQKGSIMKMTAEDLFAVIEKQAAEGVDFMGLHCGLTLGVLTRAKEQGRIGGVVSHGGALLAGWMLYHNQENPLYTHYDKLLEICHKYDVTLSLADALRPGAISDSLDRSQIQELIILGELVDRSRAAGVQIMIKGPGHVPVNQLKTTVETMKKMCGGAPYFVFGPVVTDIAPGFDHITSAIGGAIAAAAGADFLCYVTPAEHVGFPDREDVHTGVITARIAAHAADIAKGIPGAADWDLEMSKARKALDWEGQIRLCIDPLKARQVREERSPNEAEVCTMCGTYCAMKVVGEYLGKEGEIC